MKPWQWLPAQISHDLSPFLLRFHERLSSLQTLTWSPLTWKNMDFTNPLGLAGGVDKTAKLVQSWWTLGPGFVEVGTITPKPQTGYAGKVICRDFKNKALWNKMGFPNKGLDFTVEQLKKIYKPRFTPIFANIGKNKSTPNAKASHDYVLCIHKLKDLVDAFVINISSPNTEGLRDLLKPQNLQNFLEPIVKANSDQALPLLLKISPDINHDELKQILKISLDLNFDGWILTNTTSERQHNLNFPQQGGVSGQPLAKKSKELLLQTIDYLGDQRKDKLIVSSGGVLNANDVFERLHLGANLVQVYTALIFNGPFFFRHVAEKAAFRH